MKEKDYLDKIYGCWLGKNIGGTLGGPFEGHEGFLKLDFYDPVPTTPIPNDDLDLQLVWLAHMQEQGAELDSNHLGNAWLEHINYNCDEYGVARWNLRRGIKPPLCGLHNNWFTRGMGGAIRSEIWACLFPGNSNTAAYYAVQDAQVDHADEGVYVEGFLAVCESEAFIKKNVSEVIQEGLNFLPEFSLLKKAIQYIQELYNNGLSYEKTREKIMERYSSPNFTDCLMNLCFIILGLLYGEGDFEKSILYAVNCGQDTDCTAATVGAFLGILKGRKGIPERWSRPIGMALKVTDYIHSLSLPKDLKELTQQTYELANNFEREKLSVLKFPYAENKINDFSDEILWKVNQEVVKFESIHMKPRQKVHSLTNELEMTTTVRMPAEGEIMVMACSDVPFDFYFGRRKLISWEKKEPIVPAFPRVKGGKTIKINVERDKSYEISFRSVDFGKDSRLTVAFADTNMNFLDVTYEIEPKNKQ